MVNNLNFLLIPFNIYNINESKMKLNIYLIINNLKFYYCLKIADINYELFF